MGFLSSLSGIPLAIPVLSYTVLKIKDRVLWMLISGLVSFGLVGSVAPVAKRLSFEAFYRDGFWFTMVGVVLTFSLIYTYLVQGWAHKIPTLYKRGTGSTEKKVLIDDRRQSTFVRKTVQLNTEGVNSVWEM